MKQIFHTSLEIPILSLFFGIILILGLYYFGKIFLKTTKLNLIINKYSYDNYQNILVSTSIVLFIFYPLFLYFPVTIVIFKFFTYFIFILGIFFILNNFSKIKNLLSFYLYKLTDKKNYQIEIIIIFLLLSGFILLSFAPVTNADSLDYHLYTAKHILNTGTYPAYLTNFHSSRLAGSGELMVLMGLIVGSEQFNAILQTTGLISLLGILKKHKSSNILYIIILSCPVLIFFTSSIKPQLLSICASSLIFSIIIEKIFHENKINKLENVKEIIFCIFILFINTQVKFSFFLSSFLFTIAIFYYSLKKRIIIETLIATLLLYLIIIFPTIIWKYESFGGNFFELFISPFSTEMYGTDGFKGYLVALNKHNFSWILFPTDIRLITQSLGLGTFLIIFLFLKIKKINIFTIMITGSFVIISYLFGQFTARFFLEPFIWIVLFTVLKKNNFQLNIFLRTLILLQASVIVFLSFFGVATLTKGVLSKNMRDNVLSNHANGYLFYKWADDKLKEIDYNGSVISSERSIGFLDRIVIPPEHVYFTDLTRPEAKPYVDELKTLDPKYFILSTDTEVFGIYKNCLGKEVFFGEKVDKTAVRNPLLKSNVYYSVSMFEINVNNFPKCFSKGTSSYNK
tara:strand:+ start:5068 stop:6948 length:1881 start_codon:yes stop_codon:yes gene_type:complete